MSRFVLITRHPSDCTELQILLDRSGLKLRPYPVLRLVDVDDDPGWPELAASFRDSTARAWIVMASPRAPRNFAHMCRERGAAHVLSLPTAAVGSRTAEAATRAGFDVKLIGTGTGAGLAQQLIERVEGTTTFVLACGRDRRPELSLTLTEAGHRVLPVVVYRMDPTPVRELPPLGPSLEAVVLTSPRAAELYLAGVGGLPLPCPHWALGPTTRDAAAALGIECRIPDRPNFESLAEELCTI
jgi:uroporphyrinogen-III synthase